MIDTYAGWKGSLPADEVRARAAVARQMIGAPPGDSAAPLPGLFAGEPPAAVRDLLTAMAADVRPATLACELAIMTETDLSGLLPQISVPTLLVWGDCDVPPPAHRGRPVPGGDPQRPARRDRRRRTPEPPRAARPGQQRPACLLPRRPGTRVVARPAASTLRQGPRGVGLPVLGGTKAPSARAEQAASRCPWSPGPSPERPSSGCGPELLPLGGLGDAFRPHRSGPCRQNLPTLNGWTLVWLWSSAASWSAGSPWACS